MASARDQTSQTSTKPSEGGKWLAVCIALLLFSYPFWKVPLEKGLGVRLPDLPKQQARDIHGRPLRDFAKEAAQRQKALKDRAEAEQKRTSQKSSAPSETDEAKEPLGKLKDVGGGALQSTAGLLYKRGSAEGHRTKHLERHCEDQPDRPGSHGVFDGGAEAMYGVLDEAYTLIKAKSPQAKLREEGAQAVYEVDLGRRIGFVGGQSGERRNHPPAQRVRMVIEDGNEVITAFPIAP